LRGELSRQRERPGLLGCLFGLLGCFFGLFGSRFGLLGAIALFSGMPPLNASQAGQNECADQACSQGRGGPYPRPAACAQLSLLQRNAGRDIAAIIRAELIGVVPKPLLRLYQARPPQQRALVLLLFLPFLPTLAQPLPPKQKLPVLVEPPRQPAPIEDQRFVGNLDDLVLGCVALTRHQQSLVGEPLHDLRRCRTALFQRCAPARVAFDALAEAHELQKDALYGLLVQHAKGPEDVLGLAGYGTLQFAHRVISVVQQRSTAPLIPQA